MESKKSCMAAFMEAEVKKTEAPAGNATTKVRADILSSAATCVCGHREQDYGSPEDNFRKIAGLWKAYTGYEFTPVDVAMMMALMKAARIKTGAGTMDSFVDLAGYAACAGEIAHRVKA